MKLSVERVTKNEQAPTAASGGLVLVVDDSAAQRRIVSTFFKRWGYQVLEAASGQDALEICKQADIALVVSDWMMPGMDGLELCQAFRALPDKPYGYFILLTSKNEKLDIVHGLDMGADDFVTKPVSSHELMARVRAGERILDMERALRDSNRKVTDAFSEISKLYEALDQDLIEARNLQQSLVREKFRDFGAAQVSLFLEPSGHVGGDLVGFFRVNDDQIGLYSIDVSGHGVASALLTVRLASHFSSSADRNVALSQDEFGQVQMRSPAQSVKDLNRHFLNDIQSDQYFTMTLACVTLSTGEVVTTQCGHPDMFIQGTDGQVRRVGRAGFPVGLMEDAEWDDHHFTLAPGERLLFVSDGATECTNVADEQLSEDGVAALIGKNRNVKSTAFLNAFLWDLSTFSGDKAFDDDVSALLFEYCGPDEAKP